MAADKRFLALAREPRQHCLMRVASASIVLAMALLGNAHAEGDALVDLLGPREVAVGEAMRGGATGATAIGENPAGLPLNHELVFEGGYGYRASDDASVISVSACDSTSTIPGCFYYTHVGNNSELDGMSGHDTANIVGTTVGYPITPHILVGSSVKYYDTSTDLMNASGSSGFAWDVGTTLRLTDLVNLGAVGYNILNSASPEFPRAIGGGIYAHPISILALSFDSRWKTDNSTVRYGGGAELFLRTSNGQTGFPLRGGMLHDTESGITYASAGIGVAAMKYGIDVGARFAVAGGSETAIIASMRFYGPRQP